MKRAGVFKTEVGKEKILTSYNELWDRADFAYRGAIIATSYGDTYIVEAGDIDAPPLLLLHGSCSNTCMWLGDMGQLKKQFRVIAVDIIGEPGKSAESRPDLRTDAYALWLKELLDTLKINKTILVGNSLGGWLALKFSVLYPETIQKLILIAPAGIVPVRSIFILRTLLYLSLGKWGTRQMVKYVFGQDSFPDEVLDYTKLIGQNFRPITGAMPIIPAPDLAKLIMPTLYLAGEADVTADTRTAAKIIQTTAPNAKVVLLAEQGHVISNTATIIADFAAGRI